MKKYPTWNTQLGDDIKIIIDTLVHSISYNSSKGIADVNAI